MTDTGKDGARNWAARVETDKVDWHARYVEAPGNAKVMITSLAYGDVADTHSGKPSIAAEAGMAVGAGLDSLLKANEGLKLSVTNREWSDLMMAVKDEYNRRLVRKLTGADSYGTQDVYASAWQAKLTDIIDKIGQDNPTLQKKPARESFAAAVSDSYKETEALMLGLARQRMEGKGAAD